MCVCAEQTFTQASATKHGFAEAFSIALDAYLKSTVRDEANEAIKVLLEGGDKFSRFQLSEQLRDIIKNHHLRMWLFFDCQWPCSQQSWFRRYQCQYRMTSTAFQNSLYIMFYVVILCSFKVFPVLVNQSSGRVYHFMGANLRFAGRG